MRRRGIRLWLTWPKIAFYLLCLLLWAAWYVPRISADRYREPIRAALGNALGRKVEIGLVQFRLLPVPGFTVSNVTIGEDPAVGPEPVAYITTLRARPRISALFGGELAFASVDLEETSVNLTRVETSAGGPAEAGPVRWNFSSLMRPKILATFPSVHMISGRVNFKFGDTKSVFYLLETDVDLWPPAKDGASWTLRVRAQPARTDRPSRGFGSFLARGEWYQKTASVVLDVKLEKSELGDMITLFEGRESGLHGDIWGSAHLAGPVSRVGVAGQVSIDDVHGWNQTPPGGSAWTLSMGGAIDVPGQLIEIHAITAGKQPPVDFRYRVADYLGHPRWGVTAMFSRLSVAPLVDLARNFGWGIPPDLGFDGTAEGAVGYSMPGGIPRMDGEVRIADSTLTVKGSPPLRIAGAELRFAGASIQLGPTAITADGGAPVQGKPETATMQASFDLAAQKFEASLATEGMAIAALRRQISAAGVPVLNQATSGDWSGNLHYSNLPAPVWSGDLHIRDADVPFEAFAEPLHVTAADGTLDAAGLSMKRVVLSAGGMEAQGEYRYEIGANHPHRFRLSMARAAGTALEKLLMPTLHRGNLLNYAFNFGRVPEPDWMRNMRADGILQVAAFGLGGIPVNKVRARMIWEGDEVSFTGVQAEIREAAFTGAASADLTQLQPRYQISGKLGGLAWHDGTVDVSGTLSTTGTGVELLAKMKASGTFRGKNIAFFAAGVFDSAEGAFDLAWSAKYPVIKVPHLLVVADGVTFQGSAESRGDGKVGLRATDGSRTIQGAGALSPAEAPTPAIQ